MKNEAVERRDPGGTASRGVGTGETGAGGRAARAPARGRTGPAPLRFLLAAALLPALAACASTGPPGIDRAPSASVPGFDTRDFPGAAAMRTWADASPYRWVGYYLPAPCHTGTSWMGRRELLEGMGWGIALIFVGEQDWAEATPSSASATGGVDTDQPRCTRTNLSPEQGAQDAVEAQAAARAEGFPAGTAIFLDVEAVDRVSPALSGYVEGWFDALLARGEYEPALYAHRENVDALRPAAEGALARHEHAGPLRLWVAASGGFALDRPPSASGVEDAWMWQGRFDVEESWGGVTLRIDENVARSPSPSR